MTNAPLLLAAAAFAVLGVATPVHAKSAAFAQGSAAGDHTDAGDEELPPYLQCVPYARQVSGIQIFGDAHTWWGQAEGRYARGGSPEVGAVMAFQPHRNMRLGHVAAISKVIDGRTVLLRHSNWSPINGRRGQIEDDVRAIDVSPANDWSMVRVWYAPIGNIGSTEWPVAGFIYPGKGKDRDRLGSAVRIAQAALAPVAPAPVPNPSRAFLSAFAPLAATQRAASERPQAGVAPVPTKVAVRTQARAAPRTAQMVGAAARSLPDAPGTGPADLLGLVASRNGSKQEAG